MRVEEVVRRPGVPAEDLLPVLRVHADRVHDAVRRFGVDAATAVEVVEASALALVDTVAERPQDVPDAAGWWFGAARRLSAGARSRTPDLPRSDGLLAVDDDQLVLAEALDELPEEERLAVLVRDAYRLPWSVVAAALGVDEDRAAQVVGRARQRAVPLLDDEPAPVVPQHASGVGQLARLGEDGPVAPRDATAQRHAKVCGECAAVVASQSRVSLLLSGLAVVALPADSRPVLLDHVEGEALRRLPPAAALELTDEEWDDWEDDQRALTPLMAFAGVLLAVLLGLGVGYLLSRGGDVVDATSPGVLPAVTVAPVQPAEPIQLPADLPPPPPIPQPRTTVFVLPSSPPPAPAAPQPTTSPDPAPSAALQVEPQSGPNGAPLRITGTGWLPGSEVVVDYLGTDGAPTGSRTTVRAGQDGRFSASLVARDPSGQPGRHEVRAVSGATTRSAAYEATT